MQSSPRPKYINYSKEFTCVPTIFFDKDNKVNYMRFLFGDGKTRLAPTGMVFHQKLYTQDVVLIHAVPKEEYDTVRQLYPDCEFTHVIAQLIDVYANHSGAAFGRRMLLNTTPQGIDIVCFFHNELQFANHFDYTEQAEVVYFTLFVWTQLGFDCEADFLYIIDKNAPLQSRLLEYIRHVVIE